MKHLFSTPVLLLGMLTTPFVGAGEFGFTFKHVLENETIYEMSDVYTQTQSIRFLYKPDWRLDIGEKLTLQFTADLSYDGYYHWRDSADPAEESQLETQFIPRNSFIKYKGDNVDLTLGALLPKLGFTTGVSPVIDVLNAQNRLSPFAQINNNPLSELMLQYEDYHLEDWTVVAFLVLGDQVDKTPVFESRFNTLPLPFNETDRGDLFARDLQGGVHLETEKSYGRVGITAMTIVDNTGTYELVDAGSSLNIVHEPFHLLGVSYARELETGLFSSDLAYSLDREINGQPDATSLYVKSTDTLHTRLQYENVSIPNLTLTMGYSYLRILAPEPDLFYPRDNHLYEAGLSWELIDWESVFNLDIQKSEGRSLTLGNDALTATASFAFIGINNLQVSLLGRRVFRSDGDSPYENGLVLNLKFTF